MQVCSNEFGKNRLIDQRICSIQTHTKSKTCLKVNLRVCHSAVLTVTRWLTSLTVVQEGEDEHVVEKLPRSVCPLGGRDGR